LTTDDLGRPQGTCKPPMCDTPQAAQQKVDSPKRPQESLADGCFDEAEAQRGFQEAVAAWRASRASPSVPGKSCPPTPTKPACSDSRVGTSATPAQPPPRLSLFQQMQLHHDAAQAACKAAERSRCYLDPEGAAASCSSHTPTRGPADCAADAEPTKQESCQRSGLQSLTDCFSASNTPRQSASVKSSDSPPYAVSCVQSSACPIDSSTPSAPDLPNQEAAPVHGHTWILNPDDDLQEERKGFGSASSTGEVSVSCAGHEDGTESDEEELVIVSVENVGALGALTSRSRLPDAIILP
jgi:hypothetical protein